MTKFVSRVSFRNSAAIKAAADSFVAKVRNDIVAANYMLDHIWNADQSGFTKELTTARTLDIKGKRSVERIVQTASALTHSYTVFPMISCNGVLREKLYVVLQEPNGLFPKLAIFLKLTVFFIEMASSKPKTLSSVPIRRTS